MKKLIKQIVCNHTVATGRLHKIIPASSTFSDLSVFPALSVHPDPHLFSDIQRLPVSPAIAVLPGLPILPVSPAIAILPGLPILPILPAIAILPGLPIFPANAVVRDHVFPTLPVYPMLPVLPAVSILSDLPPPDIFTHTHTGHNVIWVRVVSHSAVIHQ